MTESRNLSHKHMYQAQKHIAKNIRLLRHLNDMSQADTADMFNMSRTFYSNLESGMKMPDFTTVCMIADYYGISLDYFIGFDISEHFMSMITDGNHESKTMIFAEKYLQLSSGARQQIRARMNRINEIEGSYNHFPWRYDDEK